MSLIDFTASNSVSPFRSAQDMLMPLQETANRVSKQVEDFAAALDKFKSDRDVSDQELWNEAVHLVRQYVKITDHRITQTTAKARTGQGDVDKQLDSLKLESNLWTLTESLLLCKCPEAVKSAEDALNVSLEELHRYSTDRELWEAFLDGDVIAQEYEVTLDWLQQRASENSAPLEDVVADLTAQSDRGDGIWSAGLIFTKDAIKKFKRSRSKPDPLNPDDPGLSTIHRREDDKEPLVSQMDPDAPTRENAKLATLDEYHEEAAWRICWEMLRRGMQPEDIRTWWSDRKESWRTALLIGSTNQSDQRTKSSWLRMMNIASNSEYINRCQIVSEKKPARGYYEQAVYGILSGNHGVTEKTWETMDDALFSYFNSGLIERWRLFLAAHRRRIQDPKAAGYQPAPSSLSALRDYLELTIQEDLRNEGYTPQKYIEAAIMGQNFQQFFVNQGHSAAQVAHVANQSASLMAKDTSTVHIDVARTAAQDHDAVRIIAHLQLILRYLGFLDKTYRQNPYQMDNNIVNYIGFLERDSKYNLLPLYASQLEVHRIPQVLGTVLINVTDPQERVTQVKLMKMFDIDVPTVLFGIYSISNFHDLERLQKFQDSKQAAKITQYVDAANTKIIKIRSGFMAEEPTLSEERAVSSVEWMRYLDGDSWDTAISSISSLYKLFLLSGRLSAARLLLERANLRQTSMTALGINLIVTAQQEENTDDSDIDMENSAEIIEGRVQPVSPSRRRHIRDRDDQQSNRRTSNPQYLAEKSIVWAQLEILVEALCMLERWQEAADDIERYVAMSSSKTTILTYFSMRHNIANMRASKKELQSTLNDLTNSMTKIIDDDFLMIPNDETEKHILNLIRNHYIPEIILGYNSALYFAGHALSRSYLVECMNLAQEVAQNPMLTNVFVESGRMRELVTAFALDSQALLRANEAGGSSSSKPKKGKRDGAVGIQGRPDVWQVDWKRGQGVDGILI